MEHKVKTAKTESQVISKNITRIEIPKNPDMLIELVGKILEKHNQDGPNSTLNALDMPLLQNIYTSVEAENIKAKQMQKNIETLIEKHNKELGIHKSQTLDTKGTVRFLTVAVRNTLLGLLKGNEQALGDYGYVVNHSPTRKKTTKGNSP